MNQSPLTPAPPQDNNRQQAHRLAVRITTGTGVPSPRMSAATPAQIKRGQEFNLAPNNGTYFTPRQNRIANSMGRHNNPLGFLGNKAENFLQLKQIGQEAVHSFDPRTRAGLVNVLSLFAGGPKDTFGRDEFLMKAGYQPYNAMHGSPLDHGVPREGPIRAGKGYNPSIQRMVENAKGVGGYRRANPMDVIEALRREQSKLSQTREEIQNFSNRSSRSQMIHRELGNKMGGSTLVPGGGQVMRNYIDALSADGVPRAYKNGLAAYNDGNNPLLVMLHEMLFGGAEGFLRKPAPPSGGYPYGGGPFG